MNSVFANALVTLHVALIYGAGTVATGAGAVAAVADVAASLVSNVHCEEVRRRATHRATPPAPTCVP